MALADILAALEAQAAAQVDQIEAEATHAADQILSAATANAGEIRARHLREIQSPLQHERARRLNQARMAALSAINQARERLLASAIQRARQQLADLRDAPGYPTILRALAEEACAQIGGAVVLHADPRDALHLRAWFPNIQIEYDLQCWGGVAAATPDRRIVVINTFEARLEQAQPMLRPLVMQLFEDKPGNVWLTMTTPTHDFVR